MKKNVFQWCGYFTFLGTILLIFPGYFNRFPGYRFCWGIVAGLGMCLQIIMMMTSAKSGKIKLIHFRNLMTLALSIVMANGLYEWDVLISVFPYMRNVTQSTLLFILIGCLVLSFFISGIYNAFSRDNPSQPEAPMNFNEDPPRKIPLHLGQIAGYVVSVSVILGLVCTIGYAFIRNQNIIEQLSGQSLEIIIKAALWFIILLVMLVMIIGCILYSLKLFKQVMEDTLKNDGKLNIQDDSFLKLLSVLLLVVLCTVVPDMRLEEWFHFMNEPNEIAPALKGIVILVCVLLLALVIYRILESFVKSDSTLRKYVDQIFKLLVNTVGDTVISLLQFVNRIPTLITMITTIMVPDSLSWIKHFILEDGDEDEDKCTSETTN